MRWMPRILGADDVWCQLFSEPGAGSDLAGLSTRAEQRGGVYRVTRPEGVVVVRDLRRHGDRARAHRPRRAAAQGHLDARDPDGRAGRRRAPAAPDDRRVRVQRGLPRRRRGAGRESRRSRERGMGASPTRRSPTNAARRSSGRSRCSTSAAIDVLAKTCARRGPRDRSARAPTARPVVDRRRDLPPAQRAHARPARPRRGDRRRLEHREAVLGRDEPAAVGDGDRRVGSGRAAHGRRRGRARRRTVGTGAVVDARQLDHGRHERDPAQHHRGADPRPARGSPGSGASIDPLDLVDPGTVRATRLSARGVDAAAGRGAGRARRSRPATSRSGRSRSTPTSCRSRRSRCASRARRASRCARAGAGPMPPSEILVLLDPPKHAADAARRQPALHAQGGAGARRRRRTHRARRPRRCRRRPARRASSTSSNGSRRRSRSR